MLPISDALLIAGIVNATNAINNLLFMELMALFF